MKYLVFKVIPTKRIWFNLILAFFVFNLANAQNETKQIAIERAETAIRTLADGVLVVRLESNQKKINKLKEVLVQKDLSAKNRKNLQRQLEETLAETKERNTLLMNSFAENYRFSEVYFMYDYDSEKLVAGEQQGYFLNKDLTINTDLSLADNKFLTLRFGTTDLATTSGIEGMIVTDSELKDLNTPFPYAYREGGFMLVFDKIFDSEGAAQRNFPRMVEKLDKKLKRYYNEVE